MFHHFILPLLIYGIYGIINLSDKEYAGVVKLSIKEVKQSDGLWLIWNKENGLMANIIAIKDFGYLSNANRQYRIDVQGKTVATMIDSYPKARSIARKYVKGELHKTHSIRDLD